MMLFMINLEYLKTDQVVGLHVPQNQSFQQMGMKLFYFSNPFLLKTSCMILSRNCIFATA